MTASASNAISAATGGTVSTALSGQTVTVTIPAGALSASTNVTLSVYAKAGLPRLFQSRLRTTKSLPTETTFISGMGLNIGSSTILKPLSFSVTGAPNAVAGTVLRLAGSVQGEFNDVDTANETNGVISEAQNPAYAGVSLAGPSILYAFYSIASAKALPAPAVTLSVSGPKGVPFATQAKYTASEVDANGFPFLTASYSFSIDSAALGTIDATTGTLTAAATPANNTPGHVIATDQRKALTGSLPITLLSSRPATAGDSLSYAGTFSSSIANDVISSSPVNSDQSASVTQTVAVGAGSSNNLVVKNTEADNFQLSTLTTKTTSTIAYQTSGSSTGIRLLQSSATDSNNATYQTRYTATSGLLTVEPENAGSFGPNDASQTYSETDPGINVGSSGQNITTTRTTAADGSYHEVTTNADGSTNTAIQNLDGTGSYAIASPINGVQIAYGLPNTASIPAIPITLVASRTNVTQTITAPLWYSLPLTLYTETDTIAPSSGYDSRCTVPAVYGTASSKVTQAITSIDAIYGNLETQTTTAYDVVGIGTVCSIFSDTTQTFYDYTGQEPTFLTFGGATSPILTSKVTEALSLTAATVNGGPTSTSSSSKRLSLTISHAAVVAGRERFRHAVRMAKITQAARIASSLRRLQGVH